MKCYQCGHVEPRIADPSKLRDIIAPRLIVKPTLTGAQIRFLRKCVGETLDEFAPLVPIPVSKLRDFEADQRNPKGYWEQIRFRMLKLKPELIGDDLLHQLRDDELPTITLGRPRKLKVMEEKKASNS